MFSPDAKATRSACSGTTPSRARAPPPASVVTVVTRDTADLYAYLSGKLGRLEGVQHVETSPFMRKVKQPTYQPPVRRRRR
ncbi:hypothetical protein [Streptomyces sp. NPDC048425]|uniref:hypothetical protein n=1 Tax=Streptomyces sp. NPDC048425 TaxID=3365548 RepID=UPI00371CBD28